MGCCTNLADFCRRTGHRAVLSPRPRAALHRTRRPAVSPVQPSLAAGAVAPGAGLLAVDVIFRSRDRLRIARAMWKLMRSRSADDGSQTNRRRSGSRGNGQSPTAIEQFWSVILVSALGEELDRASLAAARKVLVDGFLAARDAYDRRRAQGAAGHALRRAARRVAGRARRRAALEHARSRRSTWTDRPLLALADGTQLRPDFVVLAVPWSKVGELLRPEIAARWPWLEWAQSRRGGADHRRAPVVRSADHVACRTPCSWAA